MKIHRLIGIPVAIASTLASTAFAQTVEPSNGFVTGKTPEWTASHAQDAQSTPEHRQYHRDAEQARLEWLQLNPSTMTGYSRLRRAMHQARNLAHRMFHDSTYFPESTGPSGTVRAPVINAPAPVVPAVIPSAGRSPGVERSYDGLRPSRRSIMNQAEQQYQR